MVQKKERRRLHPWFGHVKRMDGPPNQKQWENFTTRGSDWGPGSLPLGLAKST